MLIRFCASNFMSYRDPFVFSMVAGSYKRFPGHVAEINKHSILKGGFIFGANAGGKSNFVRALAFLRSVVVRGLDRTNCDRRYFRLDASGINPIGEFRVDLAVADTVYSYLLQISYPQATIVSEKLLVHEGNARHCIYDLRSVGAGKYEITSDFEETLQGEDRMRYNIYKEDALHVKARRDSLLSEVAMRAGRKQKSPYFMHIYRVYHWFRRLIVVFPNTRYGDNESYIYDGSRRDNLGMLLHAFDTGVESLGTASADIDKVLAQMPENQRNEIKASFIKDLTSGKDNRVSCSIDGRGYMVAYDQGNLVFKEVVANHGRDDDLFERDEESDGTQRLFDLLPLRNAFETEHVVVIDEFDRSLHTKATLKFVEMFYNAASGKRSQLIATTHDHNVMDLDVLRQDEIWFVDRDGNHSTRMYPLTKFKARFDKDIRRDYLLGRYGALPIFRAMNCLEHTDEV